MFKVSSRNTRARCRICSKLATCSSFFIVNFEQVNAGWEDSGVLRTLSSIFMNVVNS